VSGFDALGWRHAAARVQTETTQWPGPDPMSLEGC